MGSHSAARKTVGGVGAGRTLNAKSGSLQSESVIPKFYISIFLKPRLWLHVSVRAGCWDPGTLIILSRKGLWVTQQKRMGRREDVGRGEDMGIYGGGSQQSG